MRRLVALLCVLYKCLMLAEKKKREEIDKKWKKDRLTCLLLHMLSTARYNDSNVDDTG